MAASSRAARPRRATRQRVARGLGRQADEWHDAYLQLTTQAGFLNWDAASACYERFAELVHDMQRSLIEARRWPALAAFSSRYGQALGEHLHAVRGYLAEPNTFTLAEVTERELRLYELLDEARAVALAAGSPTARRNTAA